ncbi:MULTISPECIES: hypothetical protein [unclassified Wenzhouxiangella]|uniref:hypothetical protein n=1 Tax=unclassified Wenzhouxiangella TaxID=2613841 RepID=UPI000E32CCA3|nr:MULTISPECIES: hypothetical protein [unclassified Wenzhouxiangella]RFF27795.1 hypothetical protein DZK25_05830 [Wenzhouxiangella sp. 15181]RFP70362.1 hypothetical protein DZK26_00370 [Wenzhouxiangella sp. 15190]
MPRVRVLREASEEAEAAAAWYETERRGLGTDFIDAVNAGLYLIEEGIVPLSPMPGHAGSKGARRLILRRFPFDIVVVESAQEIIVVAFAHHSRKPGYWRNRVKP